jgi:sorting nexin-1/2
MNDGEVPSAGPKARQVSSAKTSDFQITVTDPVKHGEGVGAYVSYKVQTKTTLQQYSKKENEVIRRFRDFAWLHSKLQDQNRGIIIPPLPEKNAIQKYQMTAEFIEQRRQALQVYVNRVAAHPALEGSTVLQHFLEASEEDWALEMARSATPLGGASSGSLPGKRYGLDRTLQLFKDLTHNTASLVHGKHDEDDEDPDYLKVKEYILQLEAHLAETHRQAQRLIRKQTELGASLGDFGSSLLGLGKFEQPPLADQFLSMGEKSAVLARNSQEQAEALLSSFEAPLKEFVRLVKSAKAVMADRSSALQAAHQAGAEKEAKRNKLNKLRGVAGIKEEKIAEAERELHEVGQKEERAKATYELIVRRMSEDLARFQRERATELAAVLHDFAVSQAQLATETARVWKQLLPASASNGRPQY